MRRRFIPLLAALLLAAGASRSLPRAEGAPGRLTFRPPVMVAGSEGFAEPSIAVAPNDGTIYVTAPSGLFSGMWRSEDGGATFTDLPIPPDPGMGGLDSDVAVAPDGTVYASGLSFGCLTVSVSRDRGATWVPNPLGCSQYLVADDRQWIDLDGESSLYMTWGWTPNSTVGGDKVPSRIVASRSLITSPVVVQGVSSTLSEDGVYQWPGNVAVDDTSHIAYVAYNTLGRGKTGLDDDVIVVRTGDGGSTWVPSLVSRRSGDTFDSFVVVDTDDAGNVYATWSERRAANSKKGNRGRTDTLVAVSKDHGRTWSTPVLVNSAATPTTVFPWIVAGARGRIAIGYYGTATPGFSPETTGTGSSWYLYTAVSTNMLSARPTFQVAKAAPASIHAGGICTSGTDCGSADRDLLDFFELDLDPQGRLVIAYADDAHSADAGAVAVFVTVQSAGPRLR